MEAIYKTVLKEAYEQLDYSNELKEKTKYYHLKIVFETKRKLWRSVIAFFKSNNFEKLKDEYLFFIKTKRLHLTQLKKIYYLDYLEHKDILNNRTPPVNQNLTVDFP